MDRKVRAFYSEGVILGEPYQLLLEYGERRNRDWKLKMEVLNALRESLGVSREVSEEKKRKANSKAMDMVDKDKLLTEGGK